MEPIKGTLALDAMPDDMLIGELKRRGRLREFGYRATISERETHDAKQVEFIQLHQDDRAFHDIGHFMRIQGAIEISEERTMFGGLARTYRAFGLMPASEPAPEKERA